jgi:hypothetical protein
VTFGAASTLEAHISAVHLKIKRSVKGCTIGLLGAVIKLGMAACIVLSAVSEISQFSLPFTVHTLFANCSNLISSPLLEDEGLLAPGAAGTDLTPDNWDDAKFGKSVFIKFQAPW